MTFREALKYQQAPDSVPQNLHSKGFFRTYSFWTDEPKDFKLSQVFTTTVLHRASQAPKDYITFNIPKASGGTRTIEAPEPPLKKAQRDVTDFLQDKLKVLPHNSAYAYTKGRCAYDALVTHQRRNARWFLKVDLKDFFPSITRHVLDRRLPEVYPLDQMKQKCRISWDRLLDIAVNHDDCLPQGSPLSPVLSNLVMMDFDHTLSKILRDFEGKHYTYTRYADDLLISCPFSFEYQPILNVIEELLEENELGMKINYGKLRYGSHAGRNWNLGLMYNQNQQITIGNKKKRQLHSLVNNFITDYKEGNPWDISSTQELVGKLAYLKNVEPDYYHTILKKYNTKYQANFNHYARTILRSET